MMSLMGSGVPQETAYKNYLGLFNTKSRKRKEKGRKEKERLIVCVCW